MPLMKFKPTSAGRRSAVRVVTPDLHKGAPHAALVEKQGKTGGRNHHGRITTRHVGGGHKQHYRIIDFKRDKEGIPARVERIEYDPNRTAHIALLCYVDGERRYIIAPKGLKAGDPVSAEGVACVKMGTTVATNALLERKGEPTLLVITRGFRDALRIAYQNRPRLFDRHIVLPELLYSAGVEADERGGGLECGKRGGGPRKGPQGLPGRRP